MLRNRYVLVIIFTLRGHWSLLFEDNRGVRNPSPWE